MLGATLLAIAIQLSPMEPIGTWSSYVLGQKWDFIVRKDDLDRSPAWSELVDDPPLSPRSAIHAAQLMLDRLVPESRAWRLRHVGLDPVGRPDGWVYIIEFGEHKFKNAHRRVDDGPRR